MKRGQSFGLEEFVRLAISVIIAVILLALLVSVYLWWNAGSAKQEKMVENSLENFVDLINAQDRANTGDWSVRTFIVLPRPYSFVGFGNQESLTEVKKPCAGSCVCIYRDFSKNPERVLCKDLDYESVRGERWEIVDDRSDYEYTTNTESVVRKTGEGEGFIIDPRDCPHYEVSGGDVLFVKLAC